MREELMKLMKMIRKELKLLKHLKHQVHCHKARNNTSELAVYTACYQNTTQIIDSLLELYNSKLKIALSKLDMDSGDYKAIKAVDEVLHEDTIGWYAKIVGKAK